MHSYDQRGAVSKSALVVGAVVIVVLAIVAALLAGGESKDKEGMTGSVTVDGTALTQFPGNASTAPDPAVGQNAPGITGTDFAGVEQSIKADGKSKVVVVVAHWCPHCRAEIPRIVQGLNGFEFKDETGQSPLFYAISTSVNSAQVNYPPDEWLTKEGFPGRVIRDDEKGTAAAAVGTDGFPMIVVLDGQNKVLWRGSGERPKAQLVSEINGAYAGTGSTATAPSTDAASPVPSA
jgi:cytochrome c biogenesis protein CcmG/thiol:disulfide interchange protein DsbE